MIDGHGIEFPTGDAALSAFTEAVYLGDLTTAMLLQRSIISQQLESTNPIIPERLIGTNPENGERLTEILNKGKSQFYPMIVATSMLCSYTDATGRVLSYIPDQRSGKFEVFTFQSKGHFLERFFYLRRSIGMEWGEDAVEVLDYIISDIYKSYLSTGKEIGTSLIDDIFKILISRRIVRFDNIDLYDVDNPDPIARFQDLLPKELPIEKDYQPNETNRKSLAFDKDGEDVFANIKDSEGNDIIKIKAKDLVYMLLGGKFVGIEGRDVDPNIEKNVHVNVYSTKESKFKTLYLTLNEFNNFLLRTVLKLDEAYSPTKEYYKFFCKAYLWIMISQYGSNVIEHNIKEIITNDHDLKVTPAILYYATIERILSDKTILLAAHKFGVLFPDKETAASVISKVQENIDK